MKPTDKSISQADKEWQLQEFAKTLTASERSTEKDAVVQAYLQISTLLRSEQLPDLPANFSTRVVKAAAASKPRSWNVAVARGSLFIAFVGYAILLVAGFTLFVGDFSALRFLAQPDSQMQWILFAFAVVGMTTLLSCKPLSASRTAR